MGWPFLYVKKVVPMPLTEKQKRFCEYYVANGHNATKAAEDAGYKPNSARTVGSENLTKHDIQEYIKELATPGDNKRIADAREVLEYLTAVMRREAKEYTVVTLKTEDVYYDDNGKRITRKREEPKVVEIPSKLSDANRAAEMLGKNLALWDGAGAAEAKNDLLKSLVDLVRGDK